MSADKFTWVQTHKELVKYLTKNRNNQRQLIQLLKNAGISGLHDEPIEGQRAELKEIDPFSFFCYIYKHGSEKRVELLQNIGKQLGISIATDDLGIPAVQALKVCLFPFKYDRKNNEIDRLWDFFEAALKGEITDKQFEDVLTIKSTGLAKITEGLFNIMPDTYFPINGPSKPYLKGVLQIEPNFRTFSEYQQILANIKSKISKPFYELSYEAWKWNGENKKAYFVLGSKYGVQNNVDVSEQMIEASAVAVGFANKFNLSNFYNKPADEIKAYLESKGENQSSINALRLFLSLKPGDKIAIKASGSPKGKQPFLSIIAIAEVVERDGKVYNYQSKGLFHTINVKYLQTNIYKEFPLGGYGATIHKVTNEDHIHEIFETEYDNAPKTDFEKVLAKFSAKDIEIYFDFLRTVIKENNIQRADERIVFSLGGGQSRLVFTVGQRYCLTLEKESGQTTFGMISTKKINRQDIQFDGKNPRPYYCYLDADQFQSADKQTVLAAIVNELDRSNKSSFLKHNNIDFENYVFQTQGNSTTKIKPMSLTLNTIIYGPPGTGKTYMLKNEYMKMFTSSESSITREEYLADIIQHCSWWQVIALALRTLGVSKVSQIQDHEYIKIKTKLSNSSSITQTIWGQLQSHTIEECQEVRIAKRMAPLIFNKHSDSRWEIKDDQVSEQAPEIFELESKIKDFSKANHTKIERFEFLTFHQSYSYEDFVEGIKPELNNSDLSYKIEEGIFMRICNRARNDKNNNYALFIDEINRGNISSIFGELITLIEEDKREGASNEIRASLPYSKIPFSVPPNLYIIGTMNTADRSVEALDTALRRRFSFIELNPDPSILTRAQYACVGIDLEKMLTAINARIEKLLDKDYCIGHSYFMGIQDKSNPIAELRAIFQNKILPLLQEYFYGDWGKIMLVLGEGFVQKKIASTSFLAFEKYDNYEDYADKPIYSFTSMSSWTLENFSKIYE